MKEYEEILNASDRQILLALDAELDDVSIKIGTARFRYETASNPCEREVCYENLERLIGHYTGVSNARAIVYKAMHKKYWRML